MFPTKVLVPLTVKVFEVLFVLLVMLLVPLICSEPKVSDDTKSKVALLKVKVFGGLPNVPAALNCNLPPLTVVVPL